MVLLSLPTVNARCTVRTPTVTSWLTSSIMQIWGAHFLGRRVRSIPPGELPVASAHLAT